MIGEAKSSWLNPYTAYNLSRSPDSDDEEEQPEDNSDDHDGTDEIDQLW